MRLVPLFLGLLLPVGAAAADLPDCHLVAGWEQSGPARSYDSESLYEYMDGNSEGYLIYGFVRMTGVTCKQGENTFVIDISEMTDPDAAYGIFAANRDPNRATLPIGMGGQVLPRKATFAKGKYYAEISASPEGDYSAALLAFLTEMEKRIVGRTTPPETLAWFPPEKLVSARLIPESVLGLRALRRGYVAQYNEGKAFIVTEESPESAAAALKKVRSRLGDLAPAMVADEAFQAQDQYLGGLCFFRKGRYLGGYANLPDATAAVGLARSLALRIP
ncbi:MAG: DUF6599 family protein [Terriglobia bacterium]